MQMSPFTRVCFWLLSFIVICISAGASDQVPNHLELGRTLVSSLSPENTSYRYKGWVRWKGDPFTSYSEARTDCSGLISSLFERASCSMVPHQHLTSARSNHPKAEDYFNFISKQEGFKRIDFIADILPGDIIAIKYNIVNLGRWSSDSGHVMMVDAVPDPLTKDTTPIIKSTKQWEVAVIDSTKSPHGKADTRYSKDGSKRNGVGRGIFRLYSSEDGKVIGYSWSTLRSSVYYDNSTRPLAIGRVLCYSAEAAVGTAASITGFGR